VENGFDYLVDRVIFTSAASMTDIACKTLR
jgi:hypothetical protein